MNYFFIGIFLGCCVWSQAQTWSLEGTVQVGGNIPIHPKYPSLHPGTPAFEIGWLHHTQGKTLWSHLHRRPTVALLLGHQALGNDAVLGRAWHFIPALDFRLWQRQRFTLQARVGWGLAWLTRRYDAWNNPQNIAIGSHLNAAASLRLLGSYRLLPHWSVVFGLGATHYSNGRLSLPNLGVNIPFGKIGVQYHFGEPYQVAECPHTDEPYDSTDYPVDNNGAPARRGAIAFSPYLLAGIGLTEMSTSRGPKYPLYHIELGASARLARISLVSISVQYAYHSATAAFDRNNGGLAYQHFNYARLSVAATHELLFGNWGFVFALGVYLNEHRFQRSLLLTRIGFNLYLNNYPKKDRHQWWLGTYVRTYGGEAELVEIALGYRW